MLEDVDQYVHYGTIVILSKTVQLSTLVFETNTYVWYIHQHIMGEILFIIFFLFIIYLLLCKFSYKELKNKIFIEFILQNWPIY